MIQRLVLCAVATVLMSDTGARALDPRDFVPLTQPAADWQTVAAKLEGEQLEIVTVLLHEHRFRFEADGRIRSWRRLVYRVPSIHDLGDWGLASRSWEPWFQDRPVVEARVLLPDGSERRLDPASLIERSTSNDSGEVFDDERHLEAPIPGIAVGAIVEEVTDRSDHAAYSAAGGYVRQGLRIGQEVLFGRVVLEAAPGARLTWHVRGGSVPPRDESSGGVTRLVFDFDSLKGPDEYESGAPREQVDGPVLFATTAGSWEEVGLEYARLISAVPTALQLPKDLPTLRGAAATRNTNGNRWLEWLHREVRYTGLELGVGGIRPSPPETVLGRHFGDCKDKSLLLATALRSQGLDARVALLFAGMSSDVPVEVPGLAAFNHAIVFVSGENPVWIDPTTPFARWGELPVSDSNRLALVILPSGAEVVRTPPSSPESNRRIQEREFLLADFGPASVREVASYRGSEAFSSRDDYSVAASEDGRKVLAEYAKNAFLGVSDARARWSDPLDLDGDFTLTIELDQARRGLVADREAVVAIVVGELLGDAPAALREVPEEPRQLDYEVKRPYSVVWRYSIVAPAGFRLRELPPVEDLRWGQARFRTRFERQDDRRVSAELELVVETGRITAAELTEAATRLSERLQAPPIVVQFEHAGLADLKGGRPREGMASLTAAASAAGATAASHARLALALLEFGLQDDALLAARAGVRADPKSVFARQTESWILQHDSVGRHFGAGFDLAGAVAAYREAVKLDPKDADLRANLAILLEYNDSGVRYGKGAQLAEAITVYADLEKELEDERYLDNRFVDLFRLGEDVRLLAEIGRFPAGPTRELLAVASTAKVKGTEAAVREASRRGGSEQAARGLVESAARNLVVRREYGLASELLARAAVGHPQATVLRMQSDLLAKTRKLEDLAIDPAKPEDLPLQLLRALSDESTRLTALRNIVAVDEPEASSDEELGEAVEQIVSTLGDVQRKSGVDTLIGFDLAQAMSTLHVDDDGADGYRIRFDIVSPGSGTPSTTTILALREQGRMRMIQVDRHGVLTGRRLRGWFSGGDAARVDRWLDWMLELATDGSGEDPLTGDPLLRILPAGRERTAEMRNLAIELIELDGVDEARARADLETRVGTLDAEARQAVELALAHEYMQKSSWVELEPLAEAFVARHPRSLGATVFLQAAYRGRKEFGRLERMAENVVRDRPDWPWSYRLLNEALLVQNRLDDSLAALVQLEAKGRAEAIDYNSMAWMAVVKGEVDEPARNWARRAAEMSSSDPAIMNTLACVQALGGDPVAGYASFVVSIGARSEPTPADWLALGMVAESVGLEQIARRHYEKVVGEGTEIDSQFAPDWIARDRLGRLPRAKSAKAR